MVIVLSLGLFAIIVGVAYWFAREDRKTIKRIRPRKWTRRNARHDARPQPTASSPCHDESRDVRFGSKAEISACPRDVPFTPESKHCGASVRSV